jgi:hypothetical protein
MTRTTVNNKKAKEISLISPRRGRNEGMAGHTPLAQTTQQKRGGD